MGYDGMMEEKRCAHEDAAEDRSQAIEDDCKTVRDLLTSDKAVTVTGSAWPGLKVTYDLMDFWSDFELDDCENLGLFLKHSNGHKDCQWFKAEIGEKFDEFIIKLATMRVDNGVI